MLEGNNEECFYPLTIGTDFLSNLKNQTCSLEAGGRPLAHTQHWGMPWGSFPQQQGWARWRGSEVSRCALTQAPSLHPLPFFKIRGVIALQGLPWWLSGKESACHYRRLGFNPWIRKIPWRRRWQPTPVFLPEKCRGQRSLAGHSP